MISDVLFEALEDIAFYLDDPSYDDTYSGETRERILTVVSAMREVLRELDTLPPMQ